MRRVPRHGINQTYNDCAAVIISQLRKKIEEGTGEGMGMADYFEKMYGKYFAGLPDKSAYLARIGIEDENIPLTKEGLDRLQFAHLCAVPFENIDLFDYDLKVDFGTEEMYDKVVTRRRGGYCFELNSIFMALLKAVGFEVHPAGVRIVAGRSDGNLPAIAHRASIVTIGGKRYYSDVGFGMTTAPGISICIDESGEQDVQGDTYTVEDRPYNNKVIIKHSDQGPSPLFMFVPDPFNVLDFIAYNTNMQIAGFRAKRIANLRKPDGSISVDGDIFRRTQNGERIETELSSAGDAFKVLSEEFGMLLTEPLCDIAVKSPSPF